MTNQNEPTNIANKVVIITGGGTGIGKATAQAFVSQGAKVVVVGRRKEPLAALANEYEGDVEYLQADITQSGKSKAIIDFTIEKFGRVDVLVNNAGAGIIKPLSLLTDVEIETMLSANLKGMLVLSRDAIPALEKTKGTIINVSSVAGQSALSGFSAYAATKAGIDRVGKILANELGPAGIRVNTVAPGLTKTDMFNATMLSDGPNEEVDKLINEATALRRLGEPEDVARSILWLASENAGWVTGQIIQASGGLMLN